MKERIKKFYKDHEEAIFCTGVTVVCASVAGLFLQRDHSKALRKAMEGGVIDSIERLHRADGISVILAHAKNGRTFRFDKDQ